MMETPMKPFLSTWLSQCLLWAGLTMAPAALATEPIKIGLLGSLTGPHSGWDSPASEGVHMAVNEINAAGGITINGEARMLQVVEEDSQSKADVAVSGAQRILSDDDVHVMLGMLVSTPGMASAVPIARAKVLYVGGFTLMDTLLGKPGYELFFRALPSDETTGKYFVPAVADKLEIKKIGFLYPNEDATRAVAKVYQDLFTEAGVETDITEFFQPGTTDFAPVLRKFQNQGLDALFVGNSDPDTEAIVRQSLELGNLPTKFVYRGGSGGPAAKYANNIDGFVWQILTRDLDFTTDQKVLDWIDRYSAFTNKKVSATTYWALTFYDTVFMLAEAMKTAQTSSDPEAIAAALRDIQHDGVRNLRYDEHGAVHANIDIGLIQNGETISIPVTVN